MAFFPQFGVKYGKFDTCTRISEIFRNFPLPQVFWHDMECEMSPHSSNGSQELLFCQHLAKTLSDFVDLREFAGFWLFFCGFLGFLQGNDFSLEKLLHLVQIFFLIRSNFSSVSPCLIFLCPMSSIFHILEAVCSQTNKNHFFLRFG